MKTWILLLACWPLCAAAEDATTWRAEGALALQQAKRLQPNSRPAKNIILMVGDGMGITTVTAGRIFAGQQRGLEGERYQLGFEKLPYVALSKTYSANQQTPDSAPTMSAMVTGVKTNDGVLSLSQDVEHGDPDVKHVTAASMPTILELAEQSGRSSGVVTTTRVTHATPAATYAHSSHRDWEVDSGLPRGVTVPDIAAQLVDRFGPGGIGDGLEVVLGGGRSYFMPGSQPDPEYAGQAGKRQDGRDLVAEFQHKFSARYVWNQAQFDAIDPRQTKRLLGLFEPSHLNYEHDRPADKAGEPPLSAMTAKAIQILQQNPRGYFLMVEGGRIDHASHAGNAYRTLSETAEFSRAVETVLSLVDLNETLVIVTADHSHTLSLGGYPQRGNPILGTVKEPGQREAKKAKDGKPYTTLQFANGPGAALTGSRREQDGAQADTQAADYHQPALVPLEAETHGGEDVAIFAGGPNAYLFHGVQEQSYIFYVMKDAFRLP
ncbi:MAG TPA: alkaline phosphatase [Methylophilus sp.]